MLSTHAVTYTIEHIKRDTLGHFYKITIPGIEDAETFIFAVAMMVKAMNSKVQVIKMVRNMPSSSYSTSLPLLECKLFVEECMRIHNVTLDR